MQSTSAWEATRRTWQEGLLCGDNKKTLQGKIDSNTSFTAPPRPAAGPLRGERGGERGRGGAGGGRVVHRVVFGCPFCRKLGVLCLIDFSNESEHFLG